MIKRFLARRRLELRYHPVWCSHPVGRRPVGPRPMLGLHRLPDPHCRTCGGEGAVMCAGPDADEPDSDNCHCAPFLPLAHLWLPKVPGWARRPRHSAWHNPSWCTRRNCAGSDEPPF
ncbi:hypothetical protein ABZ419_22970 [Streptomyces cinnamoneus]|uniref:hypothetical protein n=1 Tax=Streptomyces cinnamoneus TaxID=53446 RepID=UPI0033CF6516